MDSAAHCQSSGRINKFREFLRICREANFKKTNLSLAKKKWKIPPKANEEFVWKVEEVLEIYKRESMTQNILCFVLMRAANTRGDRKPADVAWNASKISLIHVTNVKFVTHFNLC